MSRKIINKLLTSQLQSKTSIELYVSGNSMNPFIQEGDKITIIQELMYYPGDILVFVYKSKNILVHRLLKRENNIYFCKGDNSFRLEDIKENQIIGKVIRINGSSVIPCSDELINLSYLVNREYRKCKYSREDTQMSAIYIQYKKYIESLYDMQVN